MIHGGKSSLRPRKKNRITFNDPRKGSVATAPGAGPAWAAAHGPAARGEDMNNSLIKPHKQETALDRERRRMQESLALLEPVREAKHKAASSPKREARLIFGLDLTASREWSLDQARLATAGMFAAIQDIGSVAVKLVYYRGTNECRESPWYGNMDLLCRSMMGLACKCGGTQI